MTPQTLEQMDREAAHKYSFGHPDNDSHAEKYAREDGFLAGIRYERERLKLSEADLQYINIIKIYNEDAKSGPVTGLLNIISRLTANDQAKGG